jgi:hypothetical protein
MCFLSLLTAKYSKYTNGIIDLEQEPTEVTERKPQSEVLLDFTADEHPSFVPQCGLRRTGG